MKSTTVYRLLSMAAFAFVVSACGGGTGSFTPGGAPAAPNGGIAQNGNTGASSADRIVQTTLSVTPTDINLPLDGGVSGRLTLSADRAATLGIGARVLTSSTRTTQAASSCPLIFTQIPLVNPSSSPLTVQLSGFSIFVPCSQGTLKYDVELYRILPNLGTPVKVGEITANGRLLTFAPKQPPHFTLDANSTYILAVFPHAATVNIYPASPGSYNLSGGTTINGEQLTFSFTSASGGRAFSSTCYSANSPEGMAIIKQQAILGTPHVVCVLEPIGGNITFGTSDQGSVGFVVTNVPTDIAIIDLDGPLRPIPCSSPSPGPYGTTNSDCDTTAFSTSQYRNVISANVADLQLCASTYNNDCFASPSPYLSQNSSFELLIKDDPSYTPPTFGGYEVKATTPESCRISHGANTSGPEGYMRLGGSSEGAGSTANDVFYPNAGPQSEVKITTGSGGKCSLSVTELKGLQRTTSFSAYVNSSTY